MMDDSMPPVVLDEVLDAAVRAPSSHNTQPWRFATTDHGVELRVDRKRALPVNDPDDRELTMSCGTALFNLEVAARHFGHVAYVSVLPDRADPDLIARVEFGPADTVEEWDLYDAIDLRHTARGEFGDEPVPPDLPGRLAAVAALHDVDLHIVRDSEREALAQLVVQGDHWQFADPEWREELAAWMHPRRAGDGIAVPEVVGRVMQAVIRRYDVGTSTGRHDRDFVEAAPLVAVLSTERDDRRTWVEVGRALEHVLLVAALDDLQAGFVNQPVQVPFLRSKLARTLAPGRYPQIVFRIGHPHHRQAPSSRRPVEEMLDD